MHVVFGMVAPDAGVVRIRGRAVVIRSPDGAKRLGIGMVHQHFTSVPALSVQENLWLAAGHWGAPAGRPEPGEVTTAAGRLGRRLWEGLDPRSTVASLSVGAKQRLEILMALATGAEILLLDEPTAVLAPSEIEELLGLLREFAAAGGSAVLITHKLGEVLATVDRVTVLRRGRVTLTGSVEAETRASLAAAMVGQTTELPLAPATAGRSGAAPNGATVVQYGAFSVAAGEIVGIAAVEGNGERDLLRAVAGVAVRPAGMVVSTPVAFVPEDRTTEGLIPGFSLTENLVLGLPSDPRWTHGRWIDWEAARRRMAELIPEFGIRAAGPGAQARTLSGGNQQKVVFARALERGPAVLVAENPSRGLDVHATRFVHDRLRAAAAAGAGVLIYSADLDEVLEVADRIVVMYRGRLLPVPAGSGREGIGALMLGGGG
jgi:simple sugar transport system ATP-binding protein